MTKSVADVEAAVRRIGRSIAIATDSRSVDALDTPTIDVAQFAAGVDPDEVDATSSDFRYGAVEAFSAILNALSEQMLSLSAIEVLRSRPRAVTLVAIALSPGLAQKELSTRTDIAESNLSGYIRELASSGLIQPATRTGGGKGKAWALSSWGAQTLPQVHDILSESVDADEVRRAVEAAFTLRNRPTPGSTGELATVIAKEEVYRRIEDAARRETHAMMYVSQFYGGDLRTHENQWALTQRVISDARRPITWLVLHNEQTRSWGDEIVAKVEGNELFTIKTLDEIADMRSPVQVLDDDGILYPIDSTDTGLVRPRDLALELWNGYGSGAKTVVAAGRRQ